MSNIPHPPIVDRESWLHERKQLLEDEKLVTRLQDRVNARRRRLPMVKIDKNYEFSTEEGKASLVDLFQGRRQLIVYHFMFDPSWEKGCPGCTGLVNALGDLSMLNDRQTTFVLISRAELPKLLKYKAEKGWDKRWVSSFGSDFNYDFHVTQDRNIVPLEYNYVQQEEMDRRAADEPYFQNGENHGISVFFHLDGQVYHTYSAFARGCESLTDSYRLLDITPYGRQEDFEDSPPGWPQKPTYG